MIKNSLKIENLKLKIVPLFFIFYVLCLFLVPSTLAGASGVSGTPTSTNYQLLDYGLGSGGIATSSSTNFMLQGISGEIEFASPSSSNYILGPGLTYTLEPNVPAAPAFTNPSNYYDKLNLIIDNGGNSSDTTFVIQIASNSANFSQNVYYVQADDTLGTTPVWQTYTLWGGAGGMTLIGLYPGTTYYVRVAAKRGTFQQGQYSAISNASTINPTFTFNLQTTSQSTPPFSIAIGQLNAGSVTTSPDKATVTISTNANNGGIVYLYDSNSGLLSATAGNYTIPSVSNDLSSLLQGYGAQGTTVTQTSGGPMELLSPYNGISNNVGILNTTQQPFADSTGSPVTSGQASFQLMAKPSTTTPAAGDYTDTLTVIATGSF